MRGLILEGVEQIVFHNDLPEPRIEHPTDAIVAVHRAGLCGSDLHPYFGREPIAWGTIPGHEFAGEVVEAGSDVRRFRVGDRVFSPFTTSCGECFYCRDGLSARCRRGELFGHRPPGTQGGSEGGLQGAQAEFVRVPLADGTLHKIPEWLSLEEAILLGDNFTTGYYCASLGQIRDEALVAVIGCGSVGLSAIVAARWLGAATVVAVDPVAARRKRAAELGAESVTPDEAIDRVMESAEPTGKTGADSVLEAVGSPAAQALAFQLVRPGGTIATIGVHTAEHFAFSPIAAYDKNLSYRAGRCPVRSLLPHILSALEAGKLVLPTSYIISDAHVPLRQGAEAYRRFGERAGDCVKLLLDPQD